MSEQPSAVALADCDPAALVASRTPARATPGYVIFVGVGLGGPLRLTLAGLKAIEEADVIVLNPDVDEALLGEPEIAIPDGVITLQTDDKPDLGKITALVQSGLSVVWLLTGDPLVDAEAAPYASQLKANGCQIDMVPGLSRLSLAITSTGITPGPGFRLWSGPSKDAADGESFVALIPERHVADIVARAEQSGLSADTQVLVVSDYATSAQVSTPTTLGGLAGVLDGADECPAAVIVGPAATRDPSLNWFESKPLFGWHVLVPRTKGVSGAMERRLEHHGAIPMQIPTISVEPPRNPQPMERAIQGLVDGRYQWIIFNSAQAVRAVTERLVGLGLDSRAFSGLRIAAVGADTVTALRGWGITPDLVPDGEQRSEALAAEFPIFDDLLDPINRILIPRADIAVDSLVQSMNELGWEVEDVVAYRTVRASPPPADIREAIKSGRFDAVVFSSASTVRNMVGIAGKPHADTLIAAIGPATVAACEEANLRVDVVASQPSQVDLVDALATFAAKRAEGFTERGESVRRPSQRRQRRRSK